MGAAKNNPKADEFGDFQTPCALAKQVCRLLVVRGLSPASVVEPTCGIGNILLAALDQFPSVRHGLGVDINPAYLDTLAAALKNRPDASKVRLMRQSFFDAEWAALLGDLPEPLLVVGNPPWVTNAHLGALGGANLPAKTNFQNLKGLDAITGKSNFDISEWMLIRLLEALRSRKATVAMLCKSAVARKVLVHAWKSGIGVVDAEIRPIDAGAFFGAAVDACLLTCQVGSVVSNQDCRMYPRLDADVPTKVIGYNDGRLIADLEAYQLWKHLESGRGSQWRSGIKHDCSKVMEFSKDGRRYRNGLGESIDLEDDYLYPMLKGSDLANDRVKEPRRWMLVTQRATGDDTTILRMRAPKTWEYLQRHGAALDRRASSIYRNRPRFSIFGVGEYSFCPWKVAISGFYKALRFGVVGGAAGKPIVLDDTSYFVPCRGEEEARFIASLLNSEPARGFYRAYLFWDAKRPITIELLRRLNLSYLARQLGTEETLTRLLAKPISGADYRRPSLFDVLPPEDGSAETPKMPRPSHDE